MNRTRLHHHILTHAALLIICAMFIMPLYWMVATSLKRLEDVTKSQRVDEKGQRSLGLIPNPIEWDNYRQTLTHPRFDFPLFSRNTLIIASLAVIGMTLSSAIVAYGFARIRFRGRGLLFGLLLATMMIPFPILMVSLFSIVGWLRRNTPFDLLGPYAPLWLPAWAGSAFNIFLLRQFYLTIPEELSEAAQIDGCSEWGIFWRIILPLSKPALSVVALFTFMWAWNDFLAPLIFIQNPRQYTLALGLQAFQSQQGGTDWNLLMAASSIIVAPVVCLFLLTQRTFIQGIATTGMKG